MRITGYRTLTTVHDWGRPVGDANGVFPDGVTDVPVCPGRHGRGHHRRRPRAAPGLEQRLRRHRGRRPAGAPSRSTTGCSRQVFKAGHAGAIFGTIGALDIGAVGHQGEGRRPAPVAAARGAGPGVVPAYASGLDIALTDDELARVYTTYAERGLRAAKLKGGLDVERDLRRLALVRDVLAEANPGARPGLMLDANESWTRKQAVRHVAELERSLDLTWVEEPVRRWDADGHGRGRPRRPGRRSPPARTSPGSSSSGRSSRPAPSTSSRPAAVWGVTHFLRVAALAHAHDLPVSPIGTTPVGLLHAATAVPNHMAIELQDLTPPIGLSLDMTVEDGASCSATAPAWA